MQETLGKEVELSGGLEGAERSRFEFVRLTWGAGGGGESRGTYTHVPGSNPGPATHWLCDRGHIP